MSTAATRLSPEQQHDHDLIVAVYGLRFRRRLRGQRWARCFLARKGW